MAAAKKQRLLSEPEAAEQAHLGQHQLVCAVKGGLQRRVQ
jgi:hypothetical protein